MFEYLSFNYASKRIGLKLEVTATELLRGFREVVRVGKDDERHCGRALELAANGFVKKTARCVTHVWTSGFRKYCTHHFLRNIFKWC